MLEIPTLTVNVFVVALDIDKFFILSRIVCILVLTGSFFNSAFIADVFDFSFESVESVEFVFSRT